MFEAGQKLAQSTAVPLGDGSFSGLSGPAALPGSSFFGCVLVGLKQAHVNSRLQGACVVQRVPNSLIPGDMSSF